MNHGYRSSPLEGLAIDLAALCGLQVFVGDAETWRLRGYQSSPVCLTVPLDGQIGELISVTDRRGEIDPFAEFAETIDMIVYAQDYTACRDRLVQIWRALDSWNIERVETPYPVDVERGRVRRARNSDHVPGDGFTFIDRLTITSLLPRQEPKYAIGEAVSVVGSLYQPANVLQGSVTSNA